MSLGTLLLTAAFAQNVILVHFLGPWPFPVLLASLRRSVTFSLGITGALVWVSTVYALLFHLVLRPYSLEFMATFVLLTVLAFSYLLWTRIAVTVYPFSARAIGRAMPVIFLNTTVFVVPMALAEAVEPFWFIPLTALAAGAGLFLAVVPVAAFYEHLSTARLPRVISGNVIILLATALFALALYQLDVLLATAAYPLW
ncbi:MAG: hypothetical protein EA427_13760 [Spirochaetaceae bacterium]|nr:MAG: hypothetical protein EA427_13760 [Spirochaetaceae bacterium]